MQVPMISVLITSALVALALAAGFQSEPAVAHDAGAARPELAFGRTADYDYEPPEPGTYRLPVLKPAADGAVLDETGTPRRLREVLGGRITVLSLIYTRCGDVCPLATALFHDLHAVTAEDAGLREGMQLVTVSLDPEHDTPELMRLEAEAVRAIRESAAPWRFLTTAGQAELRPILAAYDQPVGRKTDPADPMGPFTHQLRVFLIDDRGQIRNVYSLGFLDPRLVIGDVRTLIQEDREEAAER